MEEAGVDLGGGVTIYIYTYIQKCLSVCPSVHVGKWVGGWVGVAGYLCVGTSMLVSGYHCSYYTLRRMRKMSHPPLRLPGIRWMACALF